MYLRSMKILQDELQNPKTREKFEALLIPFFDEEVDIYRKEKHKTYLNQYDQEQVSKRAVSKFTDSIIRGKF